MGGIGKRIACVVLALAVGTAAATTAGAAELTVDQLKRGLDLGWLLVAAALVLLMQVGFLLLEAGMVRSKNSINVAQKNMLDFVFATVFFAAIGFMFAFGTGGVLPVGIDGRLFMLSDLTNWDYGYFVFQVMFCGTAATIVSGAVAERMRLGSYVICSIVLSALIYPFFVHWAWGSGLTPNSSAFLGEAGFVDFAGSTVVHATGAWVALAACIVMGPRLGRFDAQGRPIRITGHSPVLSAAGALLLLVGWIGFNGGSTASATPEIARIIANTMVAAGVGAVAGYLLGWWQDRVVFPEKSFLGMLGGLVAVTAGCMALDIRGAMAVGLIGGLVAVWANDLLERRFRIDDAVGAIGVHGAAGVAGTLALALLAPIENLPLGGRLAQLQVQALGAGLNFVWCFGLGILLFLPLKKLGILRVSPENERIGLNESEHGTRLGIGHVEMALDTLVKGNADLDMRLAPVDGDESEELTRLFNALMDNLQREEEARGAERAMMRDEEEAERLSALADATFEAIWIHAGGEIIDGNRNLELLLGQPLQALRGQKVMDLIDRRHHDRVRLAIDQTVAEPFEIEVIGPEGEAIPIEIRGREIAYRGRQARIGCLVDLRERKNAESRIRHLALHDPLTGLPNRALFSERLDKMIKRSFSRASQGALLLIDLDRFKDINDVHGHPAGDAVIKEAAQRLRALVGATDTVARLGGDEFAVIVDNLAFANQAADLAFRIVSSLAQPIEIQDGTVLRSGASVGVALCPHDGGDQARLTSRADTALYHAKSQGRGAYCLFEPGMDASIERRRLLEADLALAIERGEFELYMQPRIGVADARIVAYEALIRWNHPTRGMISPADFIPVAEQTGKIIPIGAWVFREACRLAGERLGGAAVSVNVSPVQFRQKDFAEMIRTNLAETGVDPRLIEIEITEGVLIDDDRHARRILKELKAIGIGIALDDFGTGYSSLGYLSRFPFDTIKIDRSFVRDMMASENARAIVSTIISLGAGLNMTVVAEGVETEEQARQLAASGCQQLQGFLLGRPAPVAEIGAQEASTVLDLDLVADRSVASLREMRGRMAQDEAQEMVAI